MNYPTLHAHTLRLAGLVGILLLPAMAIAQIATYTPAGGNLVDPLVGTANVPNLTVNSMVRVGVTPSSSAGNFRASSWPLGATNGSNTFLGSIGTGQYIQFSIAPNVGYNMDVTGLSFGIGRSATGPRQFAVRTSADGFASNHTVGTAGAGSTFAGGIFTITADASSNHTGQSLALSGPSFTDLTTTLTVRLYAFNAEAGTGTGGLTGTMVVSGSVDLAAGCGLVLLPAASTTCDNFTNGTDTYTLSIPFTGGGTGVMVSYSGSGTVGGTNPDNAASGTISISGITEGDAYSVTFSSPCDAVTVSGSSPTCVPAPCGIVLGAITADCNTFTTGLSDTYDLSIAYTGVQASVSISNTSGSGSVGGDDPALVTNGTILVSGISEANAYTIGFSAPCASLSATGAAPVCEPAPSTTIVINEVDSDTPGTDALEFIELFGPANESLTGMVLVFYNGSNDLSYNAIDLDATTLDANGFFVVGNPGVTNVDLTFSPVGATGLQNGPDAVALFFGNASDFPNGTTVTSSNIIDAVVYDTNDPDDAGLLMLVNAGQPQVNESANGASDSRSISRVPDGGTQLETSTYVAQVPTPGTSNSVVCVLALGAVTKVCQAITVGVDTYSVSIPYTGSQTGVSVVNNSGSGTVGGDDPAVVASGIIVVSGITEATPYSITFSSPCSNLVASGASPICEPEPPPPSLVINEVDYDQPSIDNGEFVEIKNTGLTTVALGGLRLEHINGSNNAITNSIPLYSVSLPPGGYYTVCYGPNVSAYCDQDTTSTVFLQNDNEGLRLVTAFGTVIDQLSYEGVVTSVVEGPPAGVDPNLVGIGLSRVPDGADTGDNSVDFVITCITPDAVNNASDTDMDGTPDCLDVCPGGPEPGSACNDLDTTTGNDVVQGDCTCLGEVIDCLGVIGGPALPGTTCSDGDPFTINDEYQANCVCLGQLPDCLGVIGGTAVPGTACNDNDPSTNDETFRTVPYCACVGTPCSQNVTIELRTDAQSEQAGWEILYQNDATVVCSGGFTAGTPYLTGITSPITESCCLPIGCFRLRVTDSAGDGYTSGGYQLRESGETGRRIIDNFGNFSTGSTSAITPTLDNGAFCMPISSVKPIFASCDKRDWVNYQFIVASEDATVTSQFILSPTNTGYEFWFFDPNGTYSYRRFRSHSTTDGTGTGATRACHFKINKNVPLPPGNQTTNQEIPYNKLLNVRIRARVSGTNMAFGPACLFKIDAAAAACPVVKLQDNPLNVPDFSCGVSRSFGGANSSANKIVANPPQFSPAVVSGNVRFQFRFRILGEVPLGGGAGPSCIVRPPQTSATLYLNWTSGEKLKCNTQYAVDVRVSKDGGATWCIGGTTNDANNCAASVTPWGKMCNVNIGSSTYCPAPAALSGGANSLGLLDGEFTLHPNPNRGDQLTVTLNSISIEVGTVRVEVYDFTGKRVLARTIAIQDGYMNATLDLKGELSGGSYLMHITAGDKTYNERLVIQP